MVIMDCAVYSLFSFHQSRVPVYLSNWPAGTSLKNIIHLGQVCKGNMIGVWKVGRTVYKTCLLTYSLLGVFNRWCKCRNSKGDFSSMSSVCLGASILILVLMRFSMQGSLSAKSQAPLREKYLNWKDRLRKVSMNKKWTTLIMKLSLFILWVGGWRILVVSRLVTWSPHKAQ